jgi:hypothetical protein
MSDSDRPELLFEFVRESDHVQFRSELLPKGGAFWVQLFRGRVLLMGRRCETNALALQFAEFLRRSVEKGEIV